MTKTWRGTVVAHRSIRGLTPPNSLQLRAYYGAEMWCGMLRRVDLMMMEAQAAVFRFPQCGFAQWEIGRWKLEDGTTMAPYHRDFAIIPAVSAHL